MAPQEFAIGSSYLVNSAGFGGRRDTMRSARVVGSVRMTRSPGGKAVDSCRSHDSLDRCGDYIFPSVPPGFHDVRHRVVTSVLYDLPVGKGEMLNVGSSFLNQIAVGGNPAEFQFGNVGRNTIRCPTSIILAGAAQAGKPGTEAHQVSVCPELISLDGSAPIFTLRSLMAGANNQHATQ